LLFGLLLCAALRPCNSVGGNYGAEVGRGCAFLPRPCSELVEFQSQRKHLQNVHRLVLRGGSSGTLEPEYEKMIREQQVKQAQQVGSIEQTDTSDNLPWPEGSAEKKASFAKYQLEYKTAKQDLEVMLQNLRLVDNQQRIHKITIKALEGVASNTSCYTPHGRMFLRVDRDELKGRLEYQHGKVLEETYCDLEDQKDKTERKMRELERQMQEVLNHVFKGRFQLFMEGNPAGAL
jgi:chaperonin cofactor prefoldin